MKHIRRTASDETWADKLDDGAATLIGAIIVLVLIALPLALL